MTNYFLKIIIGLVAIAQVTVHAQKKELTLEQAVLGYDKESTYRFHPSSLSGIQWIPGGTNYCYWQGGDLVIKKAKATDTIFSKDVAAALNMKIKRIPLVEWENSKTLILKYENSYYNYNIDTKTGERLFNFKEGSQNHDLYVGKKQCAITVDQNLYIASQEDRMGVVTHLPNKEAVAGQAIARFEFGISKGTFWSGDGSKLAFYQKDESKVHNYPLLDITKTPGELRSIKYPMAGQASELAKVGIYDVATKKLTYLETKNSGLDEEHYLTNLTWDPTNQYIFLAEVNRDQNHMKLTKYDASTGELLATLFEEKNDRYVEPENPLHFVPGRADEFLWFSERDGFMNLYHYKTSGELISRVTTVNWVVKSILGFSPNGKTVFVEGTGRDPRQNHAFAFDIKTGKMRKLTLEAGFHHVQLSGDATKMIDSYSSLMVPRKIEIIDIKSGRATNIFTAPNPLEEYNYGQTELMELKADDGSTLYGRMIKPSNFRPGKKYPVLVYVYGGPHAQLVTNSWRGGASLWMNWMAEQGYLVFTLDGRGSANRGFEFESCIHRQLGKLEVEDQMTGVEYLKRLPYVDMERMAVHGWSFGGFMTTSLMLKKPGVFKCGVAGGPVIDWKWYEVMYGERYMDRPEQNEEGYAESSLLDKVKNLKGDLLMIHGTVDDVVVMQHNLAFVKACVDNGVQIDFFPYPNHPHNVRGQDRVHLMTKVLNYVQDKLEK